MMAILNPKHGPFKEGPPLRPPEGTKIFFGADSKKATAFATFASHHLGPKEPDPALVLLESLIEHRKFQCVGKFACPGKMFDGAKG